MQTVREPVVQDNNDHLMELIRRDHPEMVRFGYTASIAESATRLVLRGCHTTRVTGSPGMVTGFVFAGPPVEPALGYERGVPDAMVIAGRTRLVHFRWLTGWDNPGADGPVAALLADAEDRYRKLGFACAYVAVRPGPRRDWFAEQGYAFPPKDVEPAFHLSPSQRCRLYSKWGTTSGAWCGFKPLDPSVRIEAKTNSLTIHGIVAKGSSAQ